MKNKHPNTKEETDFNDIPKSINKEVDEKIIEQVTEPITDNIDKLTEEFTDNIECNEVSEPIIDVLDHLKSEFTKSNKEKAQSKKIKYFYQDAVSNTTLHSKRDLCIIKANNYLKENPPERNDLIRYLTAYNESNEKLIEKYFKYDVEILYKYYKKADEKKKIGETYNPFNIIAYRNYVIYMVLKLQGEYLVESDNKLFNVKIVDSREYNPATKIPSILRGFIPIDIKEDDIKREFPTIIDMELGTHHRHTIYEILDKKTFATLLNANWPEGSNDNYYYKCIIELEKVYGGRAVEVLTPERFSEKGRVFRDFTEYEKKFIEQFIKENDIKNYVRIHDAIIISRSQTIKETTFGLVEFGEKNITRPKKNLDAEETFYYMDENGKFKTTPVRVSNFLIAEGIKRITTPDDKILLLKNTNNVIDYFNYKTNLLCLLKSGINEMRGDRTKVENVIAFEYNNTIMKALPLIESHELTYYTDTQYTFGLPFKNGFMLMDRNGEIKTKEYNSVKGFFPKHDIQERVFKLIDEVGDYENFFVNVSGENKEAFFSMIGYLSHTFKDPALTIAIILSDEGSDGTIRDGGRGKSLVGKGLNEVQPLIEKGGDDFKPEQQFVYDDLKKDRRIYFIDDVIAGFKYDDLYTVISSGINCQRKNKVTEFIKPKESPKFLITTNWVFPYSNENNSTNRRFIEYKFNKYYNKDNTPTKEFGKRFFDDWDAEEWNKFYSFIYRCVKLFFEKGLIKPTYDKDVDNFNIKFYNDIVLTEFERILNPMLLCKQPFSASDFLKVYQDYQNPLKNFKFFNHKNIRDFINTWFNYSSKINTDLNKWTYSKTHKKWFYKNDNQSINSIVNKNTMGIENVLSDITKIINCN